MVRHLRGEIRGNMTEIDLLPTPPVFPWGSFHDTVSFAPPALCHLSTTQRTSADTISFAMALGGRVSVMKGKFQLHATPIRRLNNQRKSFQCSNLRGGRGCVPLTQVRLLVASSPDRAVFGCGAG